MDRRRITSQDKSPNTSNLSNSHRFSPLSKVFRSDLPNSSPNRTITGPLLTSMSFNSNLSTYMDSKSPGLAERIVQYQNDTQKLPVTHQAKYGSPGIFPVVHLSKKDIPVRTIQSNHKVTVRLASPDVYQPYRSDYKLSESLSPSRFNNAASLVTGDDLKTHNVLDALRKLSRKRIHSSVEYNRTLPPKRSCPESIQTEAVIESRPANSIVEEDALFTISAIEASLTSTHPDMLKRINGHSREECFESSPPKKKLCTSETQTDILPESTKKVVILNNVVVSKSHTNVGSQKEVEMSEPVPEVEVEEPKSSYSNLAAVQSNLFPDFSLEQVKNDRLTSFLSPFSINTGSSTPQKIEEPSEVVTAVECITSPENKLKPKKVTFNLPNESNLEEKLDPVLPQLPPTTITVPDSIAKVDSQVMKNKLPSFAEFSVAKETTTVESNLSKSPSIKSIAPMSTSPKLGGFKFDFKSEKSSTSTSNAPNLFKASTTPSTLANNFSPSVTLGSPQLRTNTNVTASVSPTGIFSTGVGIAASTKTDTFLPASTSQAPVFGTIASTESNGMKFSAPTPAIPTFGAISKPSETSNLNANKLVLDAPKTNLFAPKVETLFPATTASTGISITTSENANSNLFSFGNQQNSSQPELGNAPLPFGKPSIQNNIFAESNNMNSSLFKFGGTPQHHAFGEPSKPPAFGETMKQSTFGETTKPPSFEEALKQSTFGETSKPPAFGEALKPPAFGEASKQSLFGETKPAAFGEPTKPFTSGGPYAFGANNSNKEPSTKPIFETPPTSKSQLDLFKFGSGNTNEVQPFPQPSGTLFGAPSNPNQSIFKAPSTLPDNPPFNATSFNSPSLPTMNLFNNAPVPNPAPTFNPVPVPNQPPAFNAMPANGGPFNSASNNMFGVVPTTMFGTTPNSNFSSVGQPQPQFGAASSGGMFNIGTGSTTPRTRTTLKARRRT